MSSSEPDSKWMENLVLASVLCLKSNIAVEIEQYAIESGAIGEAFDARFDGEQAGCPWERLIHHAAVFVDAVFIAMPSG
jgi:hypothetical protein